MVDESIRKLGDKLARARESMGLTLQQLADISGVAPSTIQKVETGTMMPSIAIMMKIARGLHKKIGFFLDEEEASNEVSLVRKRNRKSMGLRRDGFSVQSLTTDLINPEMDGFILTLPPGSHSGEEPVHHRGEELVYCIRGKVNFKINGTDFILESGDSLHFKSNLPHFWKNPGRTQAELIIICSLPALSEKTVLQGVSARRKG